ncbi:MAG TPA: AraC family transcriptional regulator [Pyrinomonadaceae bacterium]|nr:AraC family transcriptional regulator [Pyrinomonadaceae bacterium]
MDQRVQKTISLMKENLHRGWPAGRLAKFVNLSSSRLHQLFKEETGLPPAKYLRLLRMERAVELLETSYLSVKEVMAKVGVTDESHFVRDFKKTYGLTPARYRERFRSGPRVDARAGHARPPRPPAAPFSLAHAAVSPLLLRRTSHPRQLTEDNSPLLQAKRKRELLALLFQRHAAFAEQTTAITGSMARNLSGLHPISYRPRKSVVSRRPPPSAGGRQSRPPAGPRSRRRTQRPRAGLPKNKGQ